MTDITYVLRQVLVTLGTYIAIVQLRNQVLAPYAFLPASALSKANPNRYEKQRIKNLQTISSLQELSLRTRDGNVLYALEWNHPLNSQLKEEEQKWILWFNPNAALAEEEIPFLVHYGSHVGASILTFNYRGVGKSTGKVTSCGGLVLDGETAMDFLISRGISSKNILIHGHSLGGGIGTLVRRKYPEGPVINDRSFRSFAHVAAATVRKITALRTVSGGLLGLVLSFYCSSFLVDNIGKSILYAVGGGIGGGLLGYTRNSLTYHLVFQFLNAIEWKMDALEAWKDLSGQKGVIFHRLDGVILYEPSSLNRALGELEKSTSVIELCYYDPRFQSDHQIYHVYDLSSLTDEWRKIVGMARRFLNIPIN